MSRVSNPASEYVINNIFYILNNINYPLNPEGRYWASLTFPDFAYTDENEFIKLQNRIFKMFCESFKKKFRNVGGFFTREYSDDKKRLHFHLLLVDYQCLERNRKQRVYDGNTSYIKSMTELEFYIRNQWSKLIKKYMDAKVYNAFEMVKSFGLNKDGNPDNDLQVYIIKEKQKKVPSRISANYKWWSWIGKGRLSFKTPPVIAPSVEFSLAA